MTGRHNIEAALAPDGARDLPAVIPYEGIFIRDHWDGLTRCPWWYPESPDLGHQLDWRRDVVGRIGQDWLDLPAFYPREARASLAVESAGGDAWLVDIRTGGRRALSRPQIAGWSEHGQVESVHPDSPIDTLEDVEEAIPALEPAPDDGRDDLARALAHEHGNHLFPMIHVAAPLWRTYHVWGFEGMMTMVASRPELVKRACERLLSQALWQVHGAAARGAAGIWIEDCMTDMISPAAFRSLNVAFLRPLAEEIRSLGMASVYYFCGDPSGKWDALFDVGADALSLEESKKGFTIDIEDVVARAAGRCAVLGNLDAIGVLQNGSEPALRAEIARQVAAGRRNGSRFIMSLGSPVTPATPVERVRLCCDLAHALGRAQGVGHR
jgi:hypothetical protein